MVDRFTITAAEYDPWVDADPSGQWVRYSDYAALEAQLAERVRVKPLEWTPAANNAGKDGLWFVAIDVFGKKHEVIRSYHGQNGAGWTYGDTWYGNIDEAKAAAQADYESRILSALEPAAPEGQQEPVAWGVFYRGKIVAVSLHKGYHYTVPLYTRPAEQAVTEAWRPIETAPRNESGQSYGPWLLVFHKYDHEVYQARWECHGDKRGWFAKGEPKNIFKNYITHWMPLPAPPAKAQEGK